MPGRQTLSDASPRWSADGDPGRWFGMTLAGVLALSAVRAVVIFLSPLELYPDEAQYWLWSRDFAFGYYSKPPMVAWLIGFSTAVGGNAEAWVRLPALVVHALAALAQFKAAERLFGPREGALAALLYSLMPGVMLSSGVIATDAPLLLFASCALWAYAALWRAQSDGARRGAAAALGLALGLAFLSKYAAAYLVIGLALHAATSRRARALWGARVLGLAAGLTVAVLSPNLIWNVQHQFATVMHTAENAGAARQVGWLSLRSAAGFLAGQLAVFGPIPFLLLAGVGVRKAVARRLEPAEGLLLCLTAPAILIVLVEAIVARANANWAAVAYVAACPLVASWLVQWRAHRSVAAIVTTQGLFAALLFAAAISPAIADGVGFGSGLKRARGRAGEARLLKTELARAGARGPVTAIAVDRRFEFNTLAYYGRNLLSAPGAPPLRIWVREARARNQAEIEAPLQSGPAGRRVLFLSYVDDFAAESRADFRIIEADHQRSVPLDRTRRRQLSVFVGREFAPRPRDPVTGRPTPP